MKNKNQIALLLALLLASTAVTGCSQESGTETGEKTTDTTAAMETEPVETEPDYAPHLEAIDGGGADFGIITRVKTPTRDADDITAEELNGNVLDDAIYIRNLALQEKYNLHLAVDYQDNEISVALTASITAGDDNYQLGFSGISDAVSMTNKKCLLNLTDMPYVDITKPYWNTMVMEDLSLFDKYYLGIGAMNIQAYYSCGAVFFNKTVAAEYGVEDMYGLVRDGKWTLDKYKKIAASLSVDMNGDGIMDEKDLYGMGFGNFAWQIFFYGSDLKFVEKDEDGYLQFNSTDERVVSHLQNFLPLSQVPSTLYMNNYDLGPYICRDALMEDRALFIMNALYDLPEMRDMEGDFGILPAPKATEQQSGYSSFMHPMHASCVVVPSTVQNLELVGSFLEDMAYESLAVQDAFIEVSLKGKSARDAESADMIDIIISNLRMDYGLILGKIDDKMRSMIDKGTTDVASFFSSNQKIVQNALNQYSKNMKD